MAFSARASYAEIDISARASNVASSICSRCRLRAVTDGQRAWPVDGQLRAVGDGDAFARRQRHALSYGQRYVARHVDGRVSHILRHLVAARLPQQIRRGGIDVVELRDAAVVGVDADDIDMGLAYFVVIDIFDGVVLALGERRAIADHCGLGADGAALVGVGLFHAADGGCLVADEIGVDDGEILRDVALEGGDAGDGDSACVPLGVMEKILQ